ncbi:MAG: 5'-nucleotidase C-terminal domain-containing protein [Bacteroidota bacterium]|jgi:2',3'-cyclic-nucleotide 2'-phosphodiesterase (5'-nucleotidase family)|nr:5'-nucleotidase C-terminal domain-containing protein [Bacteroidota bacterium]
MKCYFFIILFPCVFGFFHLRAQDITEVYYQYHAITASPKDSSIQTWLQTYTDSLQRYLNKPLGFALENVYKQKGGGPLGNFITTAILQQAKLQTGTQIDAAFIHPAGIKGFIPKGIITMGTLFALLPYTNHLVVLPISGSVLQEFVNRIATDGGWPSTGINYAIDVYGKAKNIQIQQQPIMHNSIYHIVVTDYMANGGNNCGMLKQLPAISLHISLIETCKNYIESFTQNHEPIVVNKTVSVTNIYE